MSGLLLSSPHKQVNQKIIDRIDAFNLGASHFENNFAFIDRLLHIADFFRQSY